MKQSPPFGVENVQKNIHGRPNCRNIVVERAAFQVLTSAPNFRQKSKKKDPPVSHSDAFVVPRRMLRCAFLLFLRSATAWKLDAAPLGGGGGSVNPPPLNASHGYRKALRVGPSFPFFSRHCHLLVAVCRPPFLDLKKKINPIALFVNFFSLFFSRKNFLDSSWEFREREVFFKNA